jgi:hypothetical protein
MKARSKAFDTALRKQRRIAKQIRERDLLTADVDRMTYPTMIEALPVATRRVTKLERRILEMTGVVLPEIPSIHKV